MTGPQHAFPTPDLRLEAATGFARARVGLIIPSGNRMSEPQFRRFLPADVGVHATRLQMTGRHQKPLDVLLREVAQAASALGDAKCDVVVFHCTANAMEHGLDGEQRILQAIRDHCGAQTLSTAGAVRDAFLALAIRRYVLVSPYEPAVNAQEISYFRALGLDCVHDVALALTPPSDAYVAAPPSLWHDVTLANAREDADGYFLSCTNTTQVDVIPALEKALGKPVVNSNQATIWAVLRLLEPRIGRPAAEPALGALLAR